VSLNGHPLRLHFANALAPIERPLLVYATGDGGMHRKDLDTYRHLVSLGYPIVGFDARKYVTHLGGGSGTTTPRRLAADYARIIETARQALGIDAQRPVVLIGVSRGAGLSVVAAGVLPLRQALGGVVAVALTQEEEYVQWYRRLRVLREQRRPVMVNVYEYLARLRDLRDLPVAVIQSTRDDYLPAAKAREEFGPDTQRRWLQPIEADNHSFRGARDRLYSAIQAALTWVSAPPELPD
jgi:pimeloyl-ACP methyl ester carboxylesterase